MDKGLINGNICIYLNISRMDKLYKIQKRAARVITGSQYYVSSTEIFDNLNWDPINRLLDRRELIMYKISNGLAPKYLTKLFNIFSIFSNILIFC